MKDESPPAGGEFGLLRKTLCSTDSSGNVPTKLEGKS